MKYHHVTYNYIVIASVALFAVNTTSAMAASVGIGTTKGGTTAQVTAGLLKIVLANSGHQMRPQPIGGTQQHIPCAS